MANWQLHWFQHLNLLRTILLLTSTYSDVLQAHAAEQNNEQVMVVDSDTLMSMYVGSHAGGVGIPTQAI